MEGINQPKPLLLSPITFFSENENPLNKEEKNNDDASVKTTMTDGPLKADNTESCEILSRMKGFNVDRNEIVTDDIKSPKKEPENPNVSFMLLAETLPKMSDTSKRLVKLDALKGFIQDMIQCSGESERVLVLTNALQLVLGMKSNKDQAPLQASGSSVSKALQMTLGVSRSQLSKAYRKYGDLGYSAASFFQKKTFFVSFC